MNANRPLGAVRLPFLRSESRPLALALMLLSAVIACAAICLPSGVRAQARPAGQSAYDAELARCDSNRMTGDRAACIKSVEAGRQASREGRLDVAPHDFEQNKVSRCDALPDGDRALCLRRMQGEGTTSGSVGAGGISRDLTTETRTPARTQP